MCDMWTFILDKLQQNASNNNNKSKNLLWIPKFKKNLLQFIKMKKKLNYNINKLY